MLLPKLKEEEDRELKSQRFFFFFRMGEREREESVLAFFFFLARDAPDKKNISLPAESHHLTSRSAKRADGSQRGDRRDRREGRGGPGKKARLEAQGVVLSCGAAAKKEKKDSRSVARRGEVRVASDMPEWPWEKKHSERGPRRVGRLSQTAC